MARRTGQSTRAKVSFGFFPMVAAQAARADPNLQTITGWTLT